MSDLIRKWKKVTPIPPEMSGYGFLWECPYCGKCIASWLKYPKLKACPNCEKEVEE